MPLFDDVNDVVVVVAGVVPLLPRCVNVVVVEAAAAAAFALAIAMDAVTRPVGGNGVGADGPVP